MTQQLNESPQDRHKAIYGETHQANYLINAKGTNSETKKHGKVLFNDRTNDQPVSSFFDHPMSGEQVRQST